MNNLEITNVQLLLVEDNPRYLEELLKSLTGSGQFGYQHVEIARNIKEAKEKLDQQPYDVIIADMRLGRDDTGGFVILEEVKRRNITSVVIILTANDTVEDCRQAFRTGAWDYISKSMKGNPFEELHKSIQAAITYFNQWGKREDEAWFADHKDELLRKYSGQYIAILNNSVLATAATEEDLKRELTERKLPLFLPLIRKIGNVRPIGELITLGESTTLEFKSTLRWAVKQNKQIDDLQYQVLKTIVAFLNSEGRTILIGVEDDGSIFGLEYDLGLVKNKNLDGFEQTLMNLIHSCIGDRFARLIKIRFESIDNKQVCAIEVNKSKQPAYLKKAGTKEFYIREGNGSRSLDIEEAVNYIQMHFDLS